MNVNQLDTLIQNNQIEKALHLIEEIGDKNEVYAMKYLLEQLKFTDNHIIRNKIAIVLSDRGCQEAVEPIISLLKEPKTIGSRGTLLYALEPLNYTEHLESLFELLLNGNFEVSRHSFILLKRAKDSISQNLKQESKLKLSKAIEDLEDKIDFLIDVINELKL